MVGMNGMEQLLYRIHTTTSETRMSGLRPDTLIPRRLFLIERDANIRDIVIVIRSALKFLRFKESIVFNRK